MKTTAIIGAQWGDEGKGKITDYLCKDVDYVIRYQGGHNAGHTIWVNGKKTVLHVIPSGILHKKAISIIDQGVMFEPENFLMEVNRLRENGVILTPSRLMVSDQCFVITRYHSILDEAREGMQGEMIGTTRKGIGPAYEDKVARRGIRVRDLYDEISLRTKLTRLLREKENQFKMVYEVGYPSIEDELVRLLRLGNDLRPFVTNVFEHLSKKTDIKVVFEGAQGVLLDVDFGSYPFVTSSSTGYGGIFTGTSVCVRQIDEVIGITKAYCTRVGEGPFPTELNNPIGEKIREIGSEYGATTGRNRRCGWLDLPLLRYSVQISRLTHLALTKVDILAHISELKICYAYEIDGEVVDLAYPGIDLSKAKPLFKEFSSIKKALREDGSLSKELEDYLFYIEREVGVPVKYIAYGPDRSELLVRHG